MSLRPFLSHFSGPHAKVVLMELFRTDIKSSALPFLEGNPLTNRVLEREHIVTLALSPQNYSYVK